MDLSGRRVLESGSKYYLQRHFFFDIVKLRGNDDDSRTMHLDRQTTNVGAYLVLLSDTQHSDCRVSFALGQRCL